MTSEPATGSRTWYLDYKAELMEAYRALLTGKMPSLVRENEKWMHFARMTPQQIQAEINRIDALLHGKPSVYHMHTRRNYPRFY